MMAPPKTFAAAAVSPSSTLVRMGDMRKKDIRKEAASHEPRATRVVDLIVSAESRRTPTSSTPHNVRFACSHPGYSQPQTRERLHIQLLTFHRADVATTRWLAGVRRVFDDPGVLVHDPSVCGALARAAALAVPGIASSVGCNVGGHGARDAAVAVYFSLFVGMAVGSGCSLVCWRILPLCEVRQE